MREDKNIISALQILYKYCNNRLNGDGCDDCLIDKIDGCASGIGPYTWKIKRLENGK